MDTILWNGLTPRRFLREYWQKKPLLIRDAFLGFKSFVTPDKLMKLASRDDVQSRLVMEHKGKWNTLHGPIFPEDIPSSGNWKWSLLVQGVNHFLPKAELLLGAFDFVPHARLDDLMISHGLAGSSVGPHFDSYDVFLLQGKGHKHWHVSKQKDMSLVPDAPLRILQNFKPSQDWILGPGDMLYLPPKYAHHGIALNDCLTYSIGFRAPSAQELASQFLNFLQDELQMKGMYEDPDLALQKHPAEIGPAMVKQVVAMLNGISWNKNDVERFLGLYLSEPKPHIFFDPPHRPSNEKKFIRDVMQKGLRLNLKTLMLFKSRSFFLNGESYDVSQQALEELRPLADKRSVAFTHIPSDETAGLLYQWYRAGYVELD
jgi:50S ribosomal protein L16 3-hydroxylase